MLSRGHLISALMAWAFEMAHQQSKRCDLKLDPSTLGVLFFDRDAEDVARDLIGCYLIGAEATRCWKPKGWPQWGSQWARTLRTELHQNSVLASSLPKQGYLGAAVARACCGTCETP